MANSTSKPVNEPTPSTISSSTTLGPRPQPQHANTTILIRGQLHGDHQEAANAVVSLILVIMVGFVVFMTIFFWRKYKHITLSVPTYQYSRLSQTEGGDLTEVIDQLGLSMGNSSTDDEMEPATLPVSTTHYPCSQNHGQGTGVSNGKVTKLSNALLDDSDEELLQ